MSTGLQNDGARPAPPFGTSRRIRNRAIWAVALFASSVPPAFVGLGIAETTTDQVNVAMPLAFAFWAIRSAVRRVGRLPHPALTGRAWPSRRAGWVPCPSCRYRCSFSAALIAALFV